MSVRQYQNIECAQRVVPLLLAVVLYTMPPRRGEAEESVDFKVMHYQESDGRIGVTSPAFRYTYDLSPTLGIRVDGVYNTISGASPTGAPPIPLYEVVTRTVGVAGGGPGVAPREDDDDDDDDDRNGRDHSLGGGLYHTFAAASPGAGGGGGGVSSISELVPTGEFDIPMAEVNDERFGLNLEVIKKVGGHALGTTLSFSTEADYESYAIALRDGIDFNDRNTILTLGMAYTYDTISTFGTGTTDTKTSTDAMLGISQLLGKNTRILANLTIGTMSGYLNDTYKVTELNGVLVPEVRPDKKTKTVLYLSAIRYLKLLRASLEGSWRFYSDDFGSEGHTLSLAWFQELGDHLIVSPRVRLYEQSAADFYAVRFEGNPEFYSSDYRLSELEALSYGGKLILRPVDRLALDLSYDRYEQSGKDGVTHPMLYPGADVYTVGVRIWF
jgi:hypothetical protein